MDGFELCRRLKASQTLPDIPIIFLSALTNTADKLKGFDLNAVDYITKPFEPQEVVARIEKHLTLSNLRRSLEAKNAQLEQEIAERQRVKLELEYYMAQNVRLLQEEQRQRHIAESLRQAMLAFSASLDPGGGHSRNFGPIKGHYALRQRGPLFA